MKKTYIITFDIKNPDRRSQFKVKLKEFGSYCPIHENAWAIRTEKKATEIRESITNLLLPEDRLFIIRSGTEAAWRNSYGVKHNEWLKKNL